MGGHSWALLLMLLIPYHVALRGPPLLQESDSQQDHRGPGADGHGFVAGLSGVLYLVQR